MAAERKVLTLEFSRSEIKRSRVLSLSDLALEGLTSPANKRTPSLTPTPTQFLFPKSVTAEQEAYASGFARALEEIYRTQGRPGQTTNTSTTSKCASTEMNCTGTSLTSSCRTVSTPRSSTADCSLNESSTLSAGVNDRRHLTNMDCHIGLPLGDGSSDSVTTSRHCQKGAGFACAAVIPPSFDVLPSSHHQDVFCRLSESVFPPLHSISSASSCHQVVASASKSLLNSQQSANIYQPLPSVPVSLNSVRLLTYPQICTTSLPVGSMPVAASLSNCTVAGQSLVPTPQSLATCMSVNSVSRPPVNAAVPPSFSGVLDNSSTYQLLGSSLHPTIPLNVSSYPLINNTTCHTVACPTLSFTASSTVSAPVDQTTTSTELPPKVNMAEQDQWRLERKRAKNRVAAARCQMRKMERIARLQDKVEQLRTSNGQLAETAARLTKNVALLRQQITLHTQRGCRLLVPAISYI